MIACESIVREHTLYRPHESPHPSLHCRHDKPSQHGGRDQLAASLSWYHSGYAFHAAVDSSLEKNRISIAHVSRPLQYPTFSAALSAVKHPHHHSEFFLSDLERHHALTLFSQNLHNPLTFNQSHLSYLHTLLSTPTPLNSFSPLPSMHRLIVSYPTVEAAISARQALEYSSSDSDLHTAFFTPRTLQTPQPSTENIAQIQQQAETRANNPRVYFGATTPLIAETSPEENLLKAPSLGKLLFISPPPSPPCGWEIREEDPPNKMTHAYDLERALTTLADPSSSSFSSSSADAMTEGDLDQAARPQRRKMSTENDTQIRPADRAEPMDTDEEQRPAPFLRRGKNRRNTVTVFDPRDHGAGEGLPEVMVEDTTAGDPSFSSSATTSTRLDGGATPAVLGPATRTARPPVELME